MRAGKVLWDNPKPVLAALKHFDDQRVTITIEPEEERRRVRQNNFYWKALDLVAKHEHDEQIGRGWTKDEFHLHYARKHNGIVLTDIHPMTGEVEEYRVGKSTSDLTVDTFSQYLDNVLNDIAEEYGLVIEPTKAEDWR